MGASELAALLRFWERKDDRRLEGDAATAAKAAIQADVEAVEPGALEHFLDVMRRQNADHEATRASVATRATGLLVFVGVVSTGTTIVAGSLASTWPPVWIAGIAVGALLLYSLVAVSWLAVRAQQVSVWTGPVLSPREGPTLRAFMLTEATDNAFAYRQNKTIVNNLVAYLADAQVWARTAVVLLSLLAVVAVAGAATKPAVTAQPVASPLVAPSSMPSPTP